MINHPDFLSITTRPDDVCQTWKCHSRPEDTTFYLTEWHLVTGASTDGVVYCEKCVKEYLNTHTRYGYL